MALPIGWAIGTGIILSGIAVTDHVEANRVEVAKALEVNTVQEIQVSDSTETPVPEYLVEKSE